MLNACLLFRDIIIILPCAARSSLAHSGSRYPDPPEKCPAGTTEETALQSCAQPPPPPGCARRVPEQAPLQRRLLVLARKTLDADTGENLPVADPGQGLPEADAEAKSLVSRAGRSWQVQVGNAVDRVPQKKASALTARPALSVVLKSLQLFFSSPEPAFLFPSFPA
ncbi:hypothetical protein NN561_017153 [Cricetulus griseus]